MQVLINGVDITKRYHIQRLTASDSDGGYQDVCEMAFTGKDAYTEITQAQEDDILIASMDGYSTGAMYVHAAFGRDMDYCISARGVKKAGREKRWASYENVTLMELMHLAAKDLGMGFRQYGMQDQSYTRLIRRNETWPEFLRRILRLESGILKCVDGKLTAISILWAQSQQAVRTYTIDVATEGCTYDEPFSRYRECVLEGLNYYGKAVDTAVPGARTLKPKDDEPGEDRGQAMRWAKGLLLGANREATTVEMELAFDPELAATSRIDLRGLSVTQGKWMAGLVKHDMVRDKTRLVLRPCIETIV